jgi:hypothetical protein
MLASELIEKLTDATERYGDMDVVCYTEHAHLLSMEPMYPVEFTRLELVLGQRHGRDVIYLTDIETPATEEAYHREREYVNQLRNIIINAHNDAVTLLGKRLNED